DMPDALNCDVHAFQVILAELELHARLDPAADAKRSEGRGITGATMRRIDTTDMLGLRPDDLHVLEAGAAVLGRDVVAAQVFDEAAGRATQRDAMEQPVGPD